MSAKAPFYEECRRPVSLHMQDVMLIDAGIPRRRKSVELVEAIEQCCNTGFKAALIARARRSNIRIPDECIFVENKRYILK